MTFATVAGIELRSPQGEFVNEPFVNFAEPENARAMRAALSQVGTQLGREYDLIIGGHREKTSGKITSLNPSKPAQVVGVHQKAGAEHAQEAMDAALRAFHSWSRVPVEIRASLLLKAAEIIRDRKFEFSAWLTYEVGKNWAEADADTAETIDFLEFYAREALRLAQATTPIQFPGERNRLMYIPLGVGAVIPPWNFPFAIMAGMTAASIVTGNTVILKPSSDSPTIAALFMERTLHGGARRGRDAGGRGQLLPRLRRDLWQCDRCPSQDALYRLYRLEARRSRHPRTGRQDPARTDLDQTHRARNGRQGLHPRLCRCRC
jgi:1-pyrroline-5-carboxylate dehydrogenase